MSQLRIFLVDDHAVIREGLKRLLEADAGLRVVGQAGNEEEALAGICALQPAVVVLNGSLSGCDAPGLTRSFRRKAPQAKVVVLTARGDKDHCRDLLEAGASSCLLNAGTDNLIEAIRQANQGKSRVERAGPASATPPPGAAEAEKLSEREASVLRFLAQGYSNKEIAGKMDLSVKTVETYKTRSMEKLRLRSRVDIVRYAMGQGWLRDL
jgi:DNA-binding NarL/FixJ family response regulator